MFLRSLLCILFCLLSSCGSHIRARQETVCSSSLASQRVDSPDPLQDCGFIAQRILVNWQLPGLSQNERQAAELRLHIRYGNQTQEVLSFSLCNRFGTVSYEMSAEEYCEKKGIVTYRVDIVARGEVVAEWKHHAWAPLILLDDF